MATDSGEGIRCRWHRTRTAAACWYSRMAMSGGMSAILRTLMLRGGAFAGSFMPQPMPQCSLTLRDSTRCMPATVVFFRFHGGNLEFRYRCSPLPPRRRRIGEGFMRGCKCRLVRRAGRVRGRGRIRRSWDADEGIGAAEGTLAAYLESYRNRMLAGKVRGQEFRRRWMH